MGGRWSILALIMQTWSRRCNWTRLFCKHGAELVLQRYLLPLQPILLDLNRLCVVNFNTMGSGWTILHSLKVRREVTIGKRTEVDEDVIFAIPVIFAFFAFFSVERFNAQLA